MSPNFCGRIYSLLKLLNLILAASYTPCAAGGFMTTIYYHPMSFPALGPVFGAEAMGIKYDKKVVDLMQGEQKTESYLAINPYGKVPALVDGDFKLSEGNAMLRYLARRENSALYPSQCRARAV
jgi:glutathione S-transferase